jgi:hypothetical protein
MEMFAVIRWAEIGLSDEVIDTQRADTPIAQLRQLPEVLGLGGERVVLASRQRAGLPIR